MHRDVAAAGSRLALARTKASWTCKARKPACRKCTPGAWAFF